MFRPSRPTAAAAALAACFALAAGRAQAQQPLPGGPVFGAGIGVSNLRDDAHLHRLGPTLDGRVGWAFSGSSAMLLVELGLHGFVGDESYDDFSARTPVPPPTGQAGLPPGDPVRSDPPRVLKTVTLMASLQIPITRGVYVRPGLGMGQHSYAASFAGPAGWVGDVQKETGSAGELAVGHQFGIATHHPVAVEGFAMISSGTESFSGWRWATGFRVVPQIR